MQSPQLTMEQLAKYIGEEVIEKKLLRDEATELRSELAALRKANSLKKEGK